MRTAIHSSSGRALRPTFEMWVEVKVCHHLRLHDVVLRLGVPDDENLHPRPAQTCRLVAFRKYLIFIDLLGHSITICVESYTCPKMMMSKNRLSTLKGLYMYCLKRETGRFAKQDV